MLTLAPEYERLLEASHSPLFATRASEFPPLPLAPFSFVLAGRLSSLQAVSTWPSLLANVRAMSVKTTLKKCQQQQHQLHLGVQPAVGPALPPTVDLDAVATAAENTPWMQEMEAAMLDCQQRGQPARCRYLLIEDPLHPNSISRFHFLIRREEVKPAHPSSAAAPSPQPLANNRAATPAPVYTPTSAEDSLMTDAVTAQSLDGLPIASAAAPAAPSANGSTPAQYRYSIRDLGSLNGVYLDGRRLRTRHEWTPLHEGARLRFAPPTKLARAYIAALTAADATNARLKLEHTLNPSRPFTLVAPTLPQESLSSKDLHLEYIFTHEVSTECLARIPQLDASLRHGNDESRVAEIDAAMAAAAAAADVAAGNGSVPAPVPASTPVAPSPPALSPVPVSASAAATRASPSPAPPVRLSTPAARSAAPAESPEAARAADAAFYARFPRVSHVEPSDVPMQADDDDLNDAPTPSNFRPDIADGRPVARSQAPATNGTRPSAASTASSTPATAALAAESRRKRSRSVIAIDDDEEDRPIAMAPASKKPKQPSAAAATTTPRATPPASPTPAASTSAAAASSTISSMMDEFTCAICSDIIYRCVGLDCGHSSFCRGCIDTWFKKKKVCPCCRTPHRGAPTPVRTVDNLISMMVNTTFTPEQKAERAERITALDAEYKTKEAAEAEKKRAKEARVRSRLEAEAVVRAQSARGLAGAVLARHAQIAGIMANGLVAAGGGLGAGVALPLLERPDAPMRGDDDDPDDEDYVPGADDADGSSPDARTSVVRSSAIFTVDLTPERRTVCRICCAIIERGLIRLRAQQVDRAGAPCGLAESFHLSCFAHDSARRPRINTRQLQGFATLPAEFQGLVEQLLAPE